MKKVLLLLITLITAHASFACSASFTYAIGSTGIDVSINNTSSYGTLVNGQQMRVIYDFGDGTRTSYNWSQNAATHTYAAQGTYTIKVVALVMDTFNQVVYCGDSTTQSVNLSYSSCYTTITTTKVDDSTFTFTAATPAGTSGMTYNWTFSTGTPLTATGSTVIHIFKYSATNNYKAGLLATSASGGGCSYRDSTYPPVVLRKPLVCSTLTASFTASTSNSDVHISNTSTYAASTNRTATYNYGDATPATASTNHTYAAAGTYTIQLTEVWTDSLVNGGASCTKTASQSVIVGAPINRIVTYVIDSFSSNPNTNKDYKVWLIKYDAVAATLTAVDSGTITNCWHCTYTFNNPPADVYLVKAAQTNPSPYLIPSYGTNSITTQTAYWNGAAQINHTNGSENMTIFMIPGTPGSGPGFIGGSISAGANRMGRTTGGSINMEVLLRNAAGDPIGCTTTDANGAYSFSNIPTGTYSIYPEQGGYTTVAANVTITTAEPSVSDIYFHVNTNSKIISPAPASIANVAITANIAVFPNPTTGIINVQGLQAGNNDIVVTDVTGRIVLQTQTNNTATTINLSAINSGVYFINIKAEGANYTNKLIVQH